MHPTLPILTTARLQLRLPEPSEVAAFVDYIRRNRAFLAATEPIRPDTYYTDDFWARQLQQNQEDVLRGVAYRFFLFHGEHIVGVANLSNIRRGALPAAEGVAKDFLRMADGGWHDHVRTALVDRRRH